MDLTLSAEQAQMQAAVRDVCERLVPPSRLVELAAADAFCPELWSTLGDLGVFSLRAGEEAGGLGLSLADATLVFEELGRALVPGPVVASHLAATYGLHPDLREPAVVTAVDIEDPLPLVAHLSRADLAVTVHDQIRVHAPSSLRVRPLERSLDPLTPLAVVEDGLDEGAPRGSTGDAQRWQVDAAVLTAALQVGLAGGALERTVAHVMSREQFGAPVGSRQAVQHRAADMLVRLTVARAAVLVAAVGVDDERARRDDTDAVGATTLGRSVSSAKLLADEAAVSNGRAAIQLHGGMGFAWETGVHLYLKRAWLLGQHSGSVTEHADRIASMLAGGDEMRLGKG